MSKWIKSWTLAALVGVAWTAARAADEAKDTAKKVDKDLPAYTVTDGVSGTIKSVGSDSMLTLMTTWAEGFASHYPNVQKEIEGKGSATAPPALIAGTAQFGPMSREMKSSESDDFQKKFGYEPAKLSVAIDMLAVYVHKDNPIRGLSLSQVDAIFSKNLKAGASGHITTWGELGLKGEWAKQPITMYGRNAASGTYGYFKDEVLKKGDFKDSVNELPGSSAVVQAVGKNKYAIGYSGIGYKTANVKAVPLTEKEGGEFVPAEEEYGYSGEYPLTRNLYIYINYKPGSELDPLRREFLRYILSADGQTDVVRDGYLPLLATDANDTLKMVGLEVDE